METVLIGCRTLERELREASRRTGVCCPCVWIESGLHNVPARLTDRLARELERAEEVRRELGNNFCRRCNYCAPCTVGISIPNVFLFQGYLRRYGLEDWARGRYDTLTAKAGDCVDCGACEERCPYQLPIREMLKRVAADFGR